MKFVLYCRDHNEKDANKIASYNSKLEAFKGMSILLKEFRNSSVKAPYFFVKEEN